VEAGRDETPPMTGTMTVAQHSDNSPCTTTCCFRAPLRALPGATIDGHLTRPAPAQADRECAIRHRHSALDDFDMRPVLTPELDAYHGGESDVAAATGTVHSQDLRKISGLAIDLKT
ncbi:hypothetical protein ACFVU3_39225, partial [Streptomyces sp. NPDC058052]|uniref:hypothetical protein n=1 Tax=Streptomyces sp. NPDC058052 TaxID=3346316 RepID=UPI0036E3BE4D